MLHDTNPDIAHKARLICDGSRFPCALNQGCSNNMLSVYLLDFISDSQTLKVFQGDIYNSFMHAHTKEKIYTKCVPEFGDIPRVVTTILCAPYGLTIPAERFRSIFPDYIRTFDLTLSRFDRNLDETL